MKWLNIEIATLRSPEFIGSNPAERAAWLCVLGYCVEQENGGLGRESATIRWKGCTSDAYTLGMNTYQARLAVAGRHLSGLGSIQEPSNHKWMPRIAQGLSAKGMDERQAQADKIALEMVG